MKCKHYQKLLREYMDRTLPAEKRAALEAHLKGCEGCREVLANERELSSSMSRLLRRETRSLSLRHDISGNVVKSLATSAPPPKPHRSYRRVWLRPGLAVAAAACLLVGILFAVRKQKPQPTQSPAVHRTSFIMCMATTYADETKTDWIERRLIYEEKNGVDRYLKIIARKPRKTEVTTE